MVNINQINKLTQSMDEVTANTPKTKKTDAFQNALTQAIIQTDETESSEMETTKAPALEELASTGLFIQDQPSIVSGKTDMLLGLLDTYSTKLENPEVSLKSIAPILERINQNADSLLKDSSSLGQENQALKDIATQTVIAARTEYEKFQRGDYLS
ncbi:MAG: hypothetical protein GY710_02525 [Desulfobacteraceae bacterium]|nr:hypothetical protein [Desulfobacteraceae bacterium]